MRTKLFVLIVFLLTMLTIVGCKEKNDVIDATEHGLSVNNSGEDNSKALQNLIDSLSDKGGIIFIPSGAYEFKENGRQAIGAHCIKMRSGVSIIGEGEKTVLKPVGESTYGLDMFYFNDYLDTGKPTYLENCSFENFVIDALQTSVEVYTSAGKGFMFNLFKNCHWKGVTVKNTDATGFGVDCPIESSMVDCVAINCGKSATNESSGASGFGIGYGYSDNESIVISECVALSNKKFGFFFEHQGRFNDQMYSAMNSGKFLVEDCEAMGNQYDFGGICAANVNYHSCTSLGALFAGFYLDDTSAEIKNSVVKDSQVAVFIDCVDRKYGTGNILVSGCDFSSIKTYNIEAHGKLDCLEITKNRSQKNSVLLDVENGKIVNTDNSWNCKEDRSIKRSSFIWQRFGKENS